MRKRVTLRTLQRQINGIVAELEQLVRDTEHWNRVRTDAEPFDVGRDRVALAKARECKAALDRGDTIASERLNRELIAAMARAVDPDDEASELGGEGG